MVSRFREILQEVIDLVFHFRRLTFVIVFCFRAGHPSSGYKFCGLMFRLVL